jgi:hypothetical protein
MRLFSINSVNFYRLKVLFNVIAWLLSFFCVTTNMAQEKIMVETKSNFHPVWTAGQSWRVEYSMQIPSPTMGPVVHPPPPEKSIWKYDVVQCDDFNVVITITEEGGDQRYELTFDPDDYSLISIFSYEDGTKEEVDEVSPHSAYFGWTQLHPVIFDWPNFQKVFDKGGYKFINSAEEKIVQTAKLLKDNTLEITLVHKDEDAPETTKSQQLWRNGEVWWDEAHVELEMADDEPPEKVMLITGKRVN